MIKTMPTAKAIEEAKKHPNGWVYVIDDSFEDAKDIPPQAILGAWKVDENGFIVGDFIYNPNYVKLNEM